MSTSSPEPLDRLDELLADAMVRELSAEETAELEQLAAQETDALVAEAEQAAVATQLAFAEEDQEQAPAALRSQLKSQAQEYFSHLAGEESAPAPTLSMPKPAAQAPGPRSTAPQAKSSALPWMVAAAALLVAVVGWAPRFMQEAPLSVQQQLQAMVENAPEDMLRYDWQVLPDPLSEGAGGGEVIWSDSEQRGFMKFSGLAANDPKVEQYQLWIFDDTTDTATPVDGGVFDIPEGQAEIVIPIDAKINVKEAFQFAITVERPGGVVVSKRERIPLLANDG